MNRTDQIISLAINSTVILTVQLNYHNHPFPTRANVSTENSLSYTETPILLPTFNPVPASFASTVPSFIANPVDTPAPRWRLNGPALASDNVTLAFASAPKTAFCL